MITAVVVDNGEPTLIKCLESLLDQTLPPDEVILAPGPRTPEDHIRAARSLGATVLPRLGGIGVARASAVHRASNEFIVSCDSDTVYSRRYVEHVYEDLDRGFTVVRAGLIRPLDPSDPLAWLESFIAMFTQIPYEFALAFRRSALLRILDGIEIACPRCDVGFWLAKHYGPLWIDYGMECYTDLPTYMAAKIVSEYLGPLAASSTPLASIITIMNLATPKPILRG